jgi:hypothetical protein
MHDSVDTRRRREGLVISCLRRWRTPGAAPQGDSTVLGVVLDSYGPIPAAEICERIAGYARQHSAELEEMLERHVPDPRHPPLLDDPALLCVLERLERDRYALMRAWTPRHDPKELRRVADLWGIRLGP